MKIVQLKTSKTMNKFIDSIMDNLPVIIFLIPLFLLVKKNGAAINSFTEMYLKTKAAEKYSKKTQEFQIPTELKIGACERLILFLERINPESFISRLNQGQYTNRDFQLVVLQEIRKEYDHNLTQQLYISDTAWLAYENAKNEIISIINTASSQTKPNGNSMEICNQILQLYMLNNKGLIAAKSILKRELA